MTLTLLDNSVTHNQRYGTFVVVTTSSHFSSVMTCRSHNLIPLFLCHDLPFVIFIKSITKGGTSRAEIASPSGAVEFKRLFVWSIFNVVFVLGSIVRSIVLFCHCLSVLDVRLLKISLILYIRLCGLVKPDSFASGYIDVTRGGTVTMATGRHW